MTIPGDGDPSPERPIIADWNGSKINIYDLNGIVQDAATNRIAIYDRSDFAYPIERMQVAAEIVNLDDEECLALESTIQLDRTVPWSPEGLNDRFQSFLAPQDQYRNDYQKRPPFHIRQVTFANTFLIADEETGNRFVLWLQHESGKLIIINEATLIGGENKLEIHPPAIHSTSTENQVKSLMRATALVADFVNAFSVEDRYSYKTAGIPLKREYVVGQERRTIKRSTVAKHLGDTGLKHTQSSSDQRSDHENPAWAEEHGIEKFEADEAITLSDIGGLERVKKMLHDVATSFKHPEVMKKWGAKRPQGVLLYGEPGTGKTMLAQALANEIGAEMWVLQSTDIYEKWLGDSEQRIKEIFSRVRQTDGPLILFFDEFESVVGITDEPSTGGADNARNAVAGIFKQEMNTLAKENPKVLVVAATNNLDRIDPSLIRSGRFDYKIYVPMPDQEARQEIVVNVISKTMLGNEEGAFKVFADDLSVSEVAAQTDGFSGADITEIFRRLGLSRAMEEARSGQEQPPITQAEIVQEIQNFRQNG